MGSAIDDDAELEPQPMVVGLDLSLRSTGIAYANGDVLVLKTGDQRGCERLETIRTAVAAALDVGGWAPDLVCIEGYSYSSKGSAQVDLGELGGVVRMLLWDDAAEFPDMRWAIVPPGAVKKYATGDGNAKKTRMVIAARDHLGYAGYDDDAADAIWLQALGLDLLGHPVCERPKGSRDTLKAVQLQRRIVREPTL